MILVLLGTQHNEFKRLLKKIEECIDKKIITENVIVQAGFTKYESNKMKIFDIKSDEELEKLINSADLIITHGGVGSITKSLKKKKKVIAVPRLHEFGEHVNNHQKDIVNEFSKREFLIGIQDISELEKALALVNDFKPKEYQCTGNEVINIVGCYIDNLK